ncbi:PREDICTED: small G protein signaling modulator 1-like [Brassica oleracea var. oleracea]|uniref:Rab-GAP TBC domain-containing protein n=1 Tax=Brassica oleracea var. oleracea TaxID=109376 RepID=A0A0D3CTD6_BRAOL|nr:PREDICTED: small G protein signaling modulator 1-like [Brassica oleracea var. oleracea]
MFGPLRLTTTDKVAAATRSVASTVTFVAAVFLTLILGGRWVVFADGSSGGAARNGYAGEFWSTAVAPSNVGLAVAVTVVAVAVTVVYSHRGSIGSPWSLRRRKHALQPKQWNAFFTEEGRLGDGGVQFLKKVRSGGVDPSIRPEVWLFLLGVYDLNSTEEERDSIRQQKQKEYENLRRQCREINRRNENGSDSKQTSQSSNTEDSQVLDSHDIEQVSISTRSIQVEESEKLNSESIRQDGDCEKSGVTSEDASNDSDSTNSEETETSPLLAKEVESHDTTVNSEATNSEETETLPLVAKEEEAERHGKVNQEKDTQSPSSKPKSQAEEEFNTIWQRIIRLDAVRANDEWVPYSPSQAGVSDTKARGIATQVGLTDYEDLEPCRILHAARLVAILEAYAVYDPEIGYCQGMSDLLSPILAVIEDDAFAFWCFVGFMSKARHNFRLDEVGIRRQLSMVSKIIKYKDIRLYRHLENLEAEDCFFVYRMVVVMFRRELTFEQTLCLWEVMWADQAAIRTGIAKATWGRIRLRAPPTEDLLLYAIAASVLQRRKTIIEKYSGMDEIMKECNSMAGRLDVWKLLDDAHDLVVNLHDKI